MMTDVEPPSGKQLAFIAKLCNERHMPIPNVAGKATASKLIDKLLATPKSQPQAPSTSAFHGDVDVEAGYWYIGETVYHVRWNNAKTHKYAKVLTPSYGDHDWTWEYSPGSMKKLAAEGSPLTADKAQEFGHMWTRCVICGHKLTVPASIAAGIGPVCIKKLASPPEPVLS